MRVVIWVVAGILCAGSCSPEAVFELLGLESNKSFYYEQYEMPPELRSFLIPFAFMNDIHPDEEAWYEKYKPLFEGAACPQEVHFVAPRYAEETYAYIAALCARADLAPPLIFTTARGGVGRALSAHAITSSLYALVIDTDVLSGLSFEQVQVLLAAELASISCGYCGKKDLFSRVKKYVYISLGILGVLLHTGHGLYLWNHESRAKLKEKGKLLFKEFGVTIAVYLFIVAVTEAAGWYLKRKYKHDSEHVVNALYDGSRQEYEELLASVSESEEIAAQVKKQQATLFYEYIRSCITEVSESVSSSLFIQIQEHFDHLCSRHDIFMPHVQAANPLLRVLGVDERLSAILHSAVERMHGRRYRIKK
jgi:hypothetical protein